MHFQWKIQSVWQDWAPLCPFLILLVYFLIHPNLPAGLNYPPPLHNKLLTLCILSLDWNFDHNFVIDFLFAVTQEFDDVVAECSSFKILSVTLARIEYVKKRELKEHLVPKQDKDEDSKLYLWPDAGLKKLLLDPYTTLMQRFLLTTIINKTNN